MCTESGRVSPVSPLVACVLYAPTSYHQQRKADLDGRNVERSGSVSS